MAKKEISRPQTANIAPFGLRMQPELKALVEAAAQSSGRSMNAEIVERLSQTFAESKAMQELGPIADRLERSLRSMELAYNGRSTVAGVLADACLMLTSAAPEEQDRPIPTRRESGGPVTVRMIRSSAERLLEQLDEDKPKERLLEMIKELANDEEQIAVLIRSIALPSSFDKFGRQT